MFHKIYNWCGGKIKLTTVARCYPTSLENSSIARSYCFTMGHEPSRHYDSSFTPICWYAQLRSLVSCNRPLRKLVLAGYFLRSLYIRILQFLHIYQSSPPPAPPSLSVTVNLFRRQWLCLLRETNIACHKHRSSWPTYDECTAKNGVELLDTWENPQV